MTQTLDITDWSPGRLAVTGKLENPRELFDKLRENCGVRHEYFLGDCFTFSFPQRLRREVVRIVENLE